MVVSVIGHLQRNCLQRAGSRNSRERMQQIFDADHRVVQLEKLPELIIFLSEQMSSSQSVLRGQCQLIEFKGTRFLKKKELKRNRRPYLGQHYRQSHRLEGKEEITTYRQVLPATAVEQVFKEFLRDEEESKDKC